MDIEGASLLFQLINKRYEKHTTIITTNKPFGQWGELFGDNMIANAILDRLVHHSHIINITGKSYRLKDKIKIDSDTTESIHNWLQFSHIFIFNFFNIFILTLTIIDENIDIKELQKKITTDIMPKFLSYSGYVNPKDHNFTLRNINNTFISNVYVIFYL